MQMWLEFCEVTYISYTESGMFEPDQYLLHCLKTYTTICHPYFAS